MDIRHFLIVSALFFCVIGLYEIYLFQSSREIITGMAYFGLGIYMITLIIFHSIRGTMFKPLNDFDDITKLEEL